MALHEGANCFRIGWVEVLVRVQLLHAVHDPGFGGDDELLGGTLPGEIHHALGRGDMDPSDLMSPRPIA